MLVELEDPRARPYTKAGNPSRALASGLRQLDEWAVWIERHMAAFREGLSSLRKRDLTGAEAAIRDTHSDLNLHYKVVIGRREFYEDGDAQARRNVSYRRGVEIVSYDRLLDQAKEPSRSQKEVE